MDAPSTPPSATDTSARTTEPDTTGLFQCGSCKRHYKRLDHLARHVRSHTQSRPYTCRVCGKSFGRADLLKRHAAGHDAPAKQGSFAASTARSQTPAANRVTRACQSCVENHLRCSEDKPCIRCVSKSIECTWERPSNLVVTPPTTVAAATETPTSPGSLPDVTGGYEITPSVADISGLDEFVTPRPMQPDPAWSYMKMFSAYDVSYKLPALPGSGVLAGQWMPMGALDFDASASTDLKDADFSFLNSYNANVPFEFDASPGGDSLDAAFAADQETSASSVIGTGTEAFKRHYWKFRPGAQDHRAAEEHNLSLPLAMAGHGSPESRVSLSRRITCARLSIASRDKILTVVTRNCRAENVSQVVTSFPSIELLDTLLQYYLTSPIAKADSFFHIAIFDPNEKRPELLAAMAAAGGVLTSDPALSKLGFAIQECLRVAISDHWERNNFLTRDLELAQAYLLTLDIGLWSGRSRKVEIAESFFMPLLTMQRRDGKFRPVPTTQIPVAYDDEGDVLKDKWKAWVRRQETRRFTFRVLQHDTSSSMALLASPLVSYAEVRLPFPDSAELWSAPTPERWKDCYLAQANSDTNAMNASAATLQNFLDNPEAFSAARKATIDMAVARSAFLSCVWGLTWEYVQTSSLQRPVGASGAAGHTASLAAMGTTGAARRWNALILESRRDEILKLMHSFRTSVDAAGHATPDMIMRIELILMHVHMPLEQVQLFAGMEGQDQARMAYPTIIEWVSSEAARKALWHAGQILRAVRQFPKGIMWGFSAVMAYQAGLALWVYGVVSQNLPALLSSVKGDDVFMDGPDGGLVLQKFFALGSGRPCISNWVLMPNLGDRGNLEGRQPKISVETVPLYCPDKVMAVIAGILRRNHNEVVRPPVVESLIQLMDGIQKASIKTNADTTTQLNGTDII